MSTGWSSSLSLTIKLQLDPVLLIFSPLWFFVWPRSVWYKTQQATLQQLCWEYRYPTSHPISSCAGKSRENSRSWIKTLLKMRNSRGNAMLNFCWEKPTATDPRHWCVFTHPSRVSWDLLAAPPAPLLEDPRHWCVFTHQAACHGIGSGTSYATTRSGLNIPAKSAKPLWFQKRQNPRKNLPQKIRFWPDFHRSR